MRRLATALAALALTATAVGAQAGTGDRNRILFSRGGAAVTANLDGSDVRQVTPADDTYRWAYDWSPDGKRLVYTAYPSGGCREGCPPYQQAWVLDIASGNERAIADIAGTPGGFAWAPDGKRIAFSVAGADGVGGSQVRVMDADGSDMRTLADGHSPTWSPDGGRLAYVCGVKLCTIGDDGSGSAEIPGTDNMHSPDWSPDGGSLLAGRSVAFGTSLRPETVIVSIGGEVERTFPDWVSPRWSPDGASFAFLRSSVVAGSLVTTDFCLPDPCDQVNGVWMADRDGGNVRRVTDGEYDYLPQFAR